MSTQQYYQPPGAYIPQRAPPPPQQRQVQYNPASYNPALYHQQPPGPPSPPAINVIAQPGHGGYTPYVPHGAPPGRTTPQPMVGPGGYVPYANIQGVIGGVNRSASLEQQQQQSGEEAPPPYSPPQRPFNRQAHLSPPTLAVPSASPMGRTGPGSQYSISPASSISPLTPLSGVSVSTQGTIYTPVTPGSAYQPHSISPAPMANAPRVVSQQMPHTQSMMPPQQQLYAQPDPTRVSSPPVHYGHTPVPQQHSPPTQQPQHHHSGSVSQSMNIPAYSSAPSTSNVIPMTSSSSVTQAMPQASAAGTAQTAQRRMLRGVPPISTTNLASGSRPREWEDSIETPVSPTTLQRASTIAGMGRRDRDSYAVRRSTNLQTIPQSIAPQIQPQNSSPPGQSSQSSLHSTMAVPPPPPGPPPPQTVVTTRRPPSEVRSTSAGLPPGSGTATTTPLTAGGSATLPNGMAVPPPPSQPPRKPVMIQPAPVGKKRAAARAAAAAEETVAADNPSGSRDTASSSSTNSKAVASGSLPFRRASSPQPPVSSSSGAPQPQSILRSQKSSGDLASAASLKSTTPKDVRFVIPDDDESEYESTADGESIRESASPGLAFSGAPSPRTPAGMEPTKQNQQQQDKKHGAYSSTRTASDASADPYFDDSKFRVFQETRKSAAGPTSWGAEKEKPGRSGDVSTLPMSAPATETRFNATPTPPFSPDSSGSLATVDEKAVLKRMTSQQLPTPPIRGNQGVHNAVGVLNTPPSDAAPKSTNEDEDLPPFYHEAIGRHKDMILEEATAASDEKRLNLFVDYVMEEARMRGEMYNNALEVLGPGLSLFPSGQNQHMTPEEEVMAFERAQAQRAGPTPLKRTSTIREQKSKEKPRERGASSVPNTPRDFSEHRGSWFDTARGVGEGSSSKGGPVVTANGEMYYPEGVYPPEKPFKFEESMTDLAICGSNTIDIEPLLAKVPPYPRQFPASENSHPSLQKIRRAISELKDLTDLHRIRFEFVASVPRIQDANAAEARMRRAQHQDDTQRMFNEGNVTYEEMDELHAKFERDEGERKTEELQAEFERFQAEVVSPSHSELMDRVDQLTALMDDIQNEITSGATSSLGVREGPELLERLNLMRTAFEAREQLHQELKNLISERNKRYKEVVIAPFINERDTERIREAEEFFDDDAKQLKVTADKEALERVESFLAKVEGNVIRGVEMEVSCFWDLAPALTEVLEKIPENLSGFKPVIPRDEYLTNPGYLNFPLQYLRTKLEYAGNSIYQHAQAQMRLLGFSMDITVMWNNAKWNVKNSQRVASGEAEKTSEWQLERQKKEEEIRQTKDWEEKMKTVKEEWSQSVGNKLNETKRRLKDQLVAEGGWGQDWIEKNQL